MVLAEALPLALSRGSLLVRLRPPAGAALHNHTGHRLAFAQAGGRGSLRLSVPPGGRLSIVWPEPLAPHALVLCEVDGCDVPPSVPLDLEDLEAPPAPLYPPDLAPALRAALRHADFNALLAARTAAAEAAGASLYLVPGSGGGGGKPGVRGKAARRRRPR